METVAFFGMTDLIENIRPIWQIEYHPENREFTQDCPGFLPPEKGGYNFDRLNELGYVIIHTNSGFKKSRKDDSTGDLLPDSGRKDGQLESVVGQNDGSSLGLNCLQGRSHLFQLISRHQSSPRFFR